MMQYLGWAGDLFLVAGLWLVGNRWRPAFLLSVAGESLWIAKSVWFQQWDLAAICAVFCLLAARSYWKWRKD